MTRLGNAAAVWAVFGAGVAGVVWWSGESLRRRSWALTEQTVELREGVFWRQHIVLPRSRVQNVTIATGPLRSALNLRTVVIHSAGAATPLDREKAANTAFVALVRGSAAGVWQASWARCRRSRDCGVVREARWRAGWR